MYPQLNVYLDGKPDPHVVEAISDDFWTYEDIAGPKADYIYEQAPAVIFGKLLPKQIETQIYRAMLESVASEQGSRMTAMDSASKNAGELIDTLTLNMNRIRQAAITKEIIEVVSGAAAL